MHLRTGRSISRSIDRSISQDAAARSQAFTVPADETRTVRAYVVAPAGSGQQDFTFTLATDDQQPETASGTTRFSAPESE